MKNLPPIFKLKKGSLNHEELSIPFSYGIVYENEGEYSFELFLDEEYPLHDIFDSNSYIMTNGALTLNSKTDTGEVLIATGAAVSSLEYSFSKVHLDCLDKITIEKPIQDFEREALRSDKASSIHYLKLEGLKMHFSNHTQVTAYRNHEKIDNVKLGRYNWDHSICHLTVGNCYYETLWRKDDDDEIVVEFLSPRAQYQSMPFSKYLEIKADLISVLSYLNGAPVHVRAEYTGSYLSYPKLDSQLKHIYSFKKEESLQHSRFIPLNDSWFKHANIMSRVLMYDFNRYRYWNQKLDLNSIIYFLGNAEQVKSVPERVFAQMILFERLSDSYATLTATPNELLVDESIFSEMITEFDAILAKNKKRIGNKGYEIMKGRIHNLNEGKRQRTDVKLLALVEGVGIEITEDISSVLMIDRHTIIHKGDIGSGKSFNILDNLLRQIITNLIKYNGPTKDTPHGASFPAPIWESAEELTIE